MMNLSFVRRILILAALFAAAGEADGVEELSPLDIAARSLEAFYYSGEDMSAEVEMVLINSRGKQRIRELTMLRKDFGAEGHQRYFIVFHAPADVKGTAFMVWKEPEKEDDRWIFLPAVNLVRRIAASDKRSSFLGSDFTYEDVSGRDVVDEDHKLVGSDELDGRDCHVLESSPRSEAEYARRVSWIDKERGLPLKEEYFDARGEKVRVFTAEEVVDVDGHWTVTKRTMSNLQTGHRTEVVFRNVAYDVGLPDDLFTERHLRQPPRKWIQK